jgi:putative tryptophan/tyrosine transport system substrate-binding protein
MCPRVMPRLLLFFLLSWCFGGPGGTPAQAGEPFIAVVITGDLPRYKEAHAVFVETLRAGGLTEDNVTIYVQTPNPDPLSWINSIRKAVGVGADLIVAYGAPAALAAKKEARNVPVLFADVYDPAALGIVKNLVAPGGEITGVSGKTPLETLVKAYGEILPARNMGVLFSSDDQGSVLQVEHLELLAGNRGFKVLKRDVKRADGVSQALGTLNGQIDCLFITESALLNLRMDEILNSSAQNKLPILSQTPGLSDRGALITLEADPSEQGQLLGGYALKILSGSKAHDLPVFTPKKVSLVINLKVAEKFGFKVPFQALSMATRVIR